MDGAALAAMTLQRSTGRARGGWRWGAAVLRAFSSSSSARREAGSRATCLVLRCWCSWGGGRESGRGRGWGTISVVLWLRGPKARRGKAVELAGAADSNERGERGRREVARSVGLGLS